MCHSPRLDNELKKLHHPLHPLVDRQHAFSWAYNPAALAEGNGLGVSFDYTPLSRISFDFRELSSAYVRLARICLGLRLTECSPSLALVILREISSAHVWLSLLGPVFVRRRVLKTHLSFDCASFAELMWTGLKIENYLRNYLKGITKHYNWLQK